MKTSLAVLFSVILLPISSSEIVNAGQLKKSPPCTSVQHRAFDFWIGEWEVRARGKKRSSARSSITKSNNGCSIHERYVTSSGYTGNSLNFYDAANKKWHQTWIDIQGKPLYLDGDFDNNKMVLSDKINRITWSVNGKDEVSQIWEVSKDNGKNWKTIFDGIYQKIKMK